MEDAYKRKTREVPQSVRDRIAASLRGRKKSEAHRRKISNSLKASTGGYWSHIPPKEQSGTTINDLLQ